MELWREEGLNLTAFLSSGLLLWRSFLNRLFNNLFYGFFSNLFFRCSFFSWLRCFLLFYRHGVVGNEVKKELKKLSSFLQNSTRSLIQIPSRE